MYSAGEADIPFSITFNICWLSNNCFMELCTDIAYINDTMLLKWKVSRLHQYKMRVLKYYVANKNMESTSLCICSNSDMMIWNMLTNFNP